jgi:hypothetical protein
MASPQKPAENLGSVPLNSGTSSTGKAYGVSIAGVGELRREVDPAGAIVEHRVRRSGYVHERLHSTGKLADELYDAAEKFRIDFERAQLSGNYARLDMFKTRSGRQDMSDGVAAAKIRINKALEALGRGTDGPNSLQSCVWNVVGSGLTLDEWTHMIRQGGAGMNADKAAGILHGALELLALHYGIVDQHRINALRQDSAYARGIKDFLDFAGVFATTAQGGEKNVIGRFLAAAQKRFGRFA